MNKILTLVGLTLVVLIAWTVYGSILVAKQVSPDPFTAIMQAPLAAMGITL